MTKKYKFHVSSWKEGKHYVALCLGVGVSSFGNTRKKALANLAEALDLYFDDEYTPFMELKSVRARTFTITNTNIFNAERDNNGKGLKIDVLIDMMKKIDAKPPMKSRKKASLLTENGLTVAQEQAILKAEKEAMQGKNVVVTNNWEETKAYLDKLKRKPVLKKKK